jgi:hypothetical protein
VRNQTYATIIPVISIQQACVVHELTVLKDSSFLVNELICTKRVICLFFATLFFFNPTKINSVGHMFPTIITEIISDPDR